MLGAVLPTFNMITGTIMLDRGKEIIPKICICKYIRRLLTALFVFGDFFSLMIQVASDKTLPHKNIWGICIQCCSTVCWNIDGDKSKFFLADFIICCVLYTARFIYGCGMPKQAEMKRNKVFLTTVFLIALLSIYVWQMRSGILSYSNPVIAVVSGMLFALFYRVKIKEEHRKVM